MDDVNANNTASKYKQLKDIPDTIWIQICKKFNSYVGQAGVSDSKLHYFRNKLNRYPATLAKMMELKKTKKWKLLKTNVSILHMYKTDFSGDGLKNLKFVSKDGMFEMVYNHKGQACTEKTDPVNMGTYNYGDPTTKQVIHTTLDVVPYAKYGNASTKDKRNSGLGTIDNTIRYGNNPTAQKYHTDKEKEFNS